MNLLDINLLDIILIGFGVVYIAIMAYGFKKANKELNDQQ